MSENSAHLAKKHTSPFKTAFNIAFKTALVTGSKGFIGRYLVDALQQQGVEVKHFNLSDGLDVLNPQALMTACQGVDIVFHCAGYAHALQNFQAHELALEAEKHWQINYQGTVNVCQAVQQAGVKSLIFVSSVKALDAQSPYGKAKQAAEQAVLTLATQGIHVCNLRLAMVYGKDGRGNLARMAQLMTKGLFPPLPNTHNKRSLVHVYDVVDALLLCAQQPQANGGTFIIAHPDAPSGYTLYQTLRQVLALKPRRWVVPLFVLSALARLADALQRILAKTLPFNSEVLAKLLDSEYYEPLAIKQTLGWQAKIDLTTGLTQMFAPPAAHQER